MSHTDAGLRPPEAFRATAPLVGYARSADTREALDRCCRHLRHISPALLLIFCGGRHDPQTVLAGFRALFGDVAMVGGSAAGAIAHDGFGYSGFEIVCAAFVDPRVTPQIVSNSDLTTGEFEAGEQLGRSVANMAEDGAVTLLFFDSVASTTPPRLHFASSLVAGFDSGMGKRSVELVGGGLLTDLNLSDGWVFDGHGVRKHAAVALVFPPSVRAHTTVMHGCRPVSTFMDITRIDGAEVFELDGERALDVIERRLNITFGSSGARHLSLIATLGQKQGDRFAEYDENAYVNRLILTTNRESGSITLFEPDFALGSKVQIMSRDSELMLQSVRTGVINANLANDSNDCFLNLYIDCAGRASARSGASTEEADLVVRGLDARIPLLGFYSGVEIAPFSGYSRPLDWTGVLTTLRLT